MTELSSATVDVLLLTCNRQRFLGELLDSLLAQTYRGWQVLARDNGSTDGSFAALEAFQAQRPGQVTLLTEDRATNLGPVEGFARLLRASAAPYSMFCDCDDVWLPQKIERTLDCMRRLEACHPPGTPLLVHTDLRVTDAALATIAASFWRYQGLDPRRGGVLGRLLVQNHVTGCTVMVNQALRDLARPIPSEAVMHDWWLALVAAAFGDIAYLPEPTVLYRQHGGNVLGAREFGAPYVLRKAASFHDTEDLRRGIHDSVRQAGAFLARYEGRLRPDQRAVVRAFAGFESAGWLGRRVRMVRYGLLKHGCIRNVAWFLRA
jgi:glycosyltransferase involved in cell wall biosynthesis